MPRSNYLPHIDALRAIAVLAVILYHLDSRLLPGGFAGVDVFFVISGFVVSKAAAARGKLALSHFVTDFFVRRVRRIIPALVVCLLVTTLAAMLWIPPSWLSDNIPRTGRAAFLGASNIVLSNNSDRYFSPIAEFNPFTHTWSLGVEEQFYLLFPLLFYIWTKGGRWRTVCAAMFAVAGAASFVHAISMYGDGQSGAYYLLSTRYWELAAGVLLFMGYSSPGHHFLIGKLGARPVRTAMIAVGTITLAWVFVAMGSESLQGYGRLAPVLSTLLLLLAALPPKEDCSDRVAWIGVAPLVQMGQLSYPLYLWHWPVIVLFKWTVGLSAVWSVGSAMALTCLLAWMSWRFVEQPFRSSGMPFASKTMTIAMALAVLFVGSAAAKILERHQPSLSFSTVARDRDDWDPSRGQKLVDEKGCRVIPSRTDLEEGWRMAYRRSGCEARTTAPRVFVIGDSHALAYGPAFSSYALRTGADVIVYNNGGCPFLSLQPWREDNPACMSHAAIALADFVPKLGPEDVVFLPSLRFPRFVDQWTVYPHGEVESLTIGDVASRGRQEAIRAAAEVIGQLRSTGAKVILQAPGPVLKAPAFRCVDWWSKANEICAGGAAIDRAEFLTLRAPMLRSLEELAKDDDGVTVFDPAEALCPEEPTCSAFMDGRPLFFDGDHISAYGNRVLFPSFMEAMKRAVAVLD